ncbi:MAG: hypothetical protein QOF21_740 [Actinomycetota bacterium]|jgi:AcrR family transcriptional regulator
MPKATKPQRVPRGTLNRAAILEAALALLEEQGSEAVTIRNVARVLGAKPMSLYSHISGKEDLLDGMFEVILSDVKFPSLDDETWQNVMRLSAGEYRRALLRHPAAIAAMHLRLQRSTGVWAYVTDWSLSVLRSGGFDLETCVHAHRTLFSVTVGATLNEAWYLERAAGVDANSDMLLPATGTPTLVEAAAYFAEPDFDAAFAFAIDTVIAGLERRLQVD